MLISTDISKTARKTVYVNNFEGVDVRGTGTLSRGIKATNLISENGKIVKRKGWKEQYKFEKKIDFVGSVTINRNKYILVYSGKRFYLIQDESVIDITESAETDYKVDINELKERPLTILLKNGIYYIVGAGEYLSLGDFGKGIELRSVRKNAYVPTTTIGIMPEGKTVYVVDKTLDDTSRGIWYVKSGSVYSSVALTDENPWNPETVYYNRFATYQMNPVQLEEANVLTPWRKNTLYGVGSSATYKLDSDNIERNTKLRIKLKVLEEGETNEYTLNEVASSNLSRGLEKGDNLKSKTITVTPNTEPIYGSGLQNGTSQKGKVLLKGNGIECYWKSTGLLGLNWNNAKLIFQYTDSDNVSHETEIATATRSSIYSSYQIYYNNASITINGTKDYIVEEVIDTSEFSEHVKAMLPSYKYNLVDQNLLVWGSLNHKTGELNFVKATTSPDGADNIEVLFPVSSSTYDYNAIDGCTLATEFGVDGNTDRLFLSGNSDIQNVDFASDSGDYSYFPTDYVYKFGLDGTKITGYARLSDDSLAIFKDTFGDESNLYIRRGKFVNKNVTVGDNSFTFKKAEFSLIGSYLSNSSINGRFNKVFDGEPIFLTRRGIYTLKSNIDLMNERKSSVSRGVAVDGVILQDLENVKDAIIYKNDYCLQVGNELFIAKANSYFIENNYKQYNWWVFGNVPACTLAVINDELWFGCDDGKICKFSDGFSDIYYEHISSGNMLLEENNKFVSFNERLRLRKNDRVLLGGDLYAKLFDNVEIINGKIHVSDVLNLGEIEVYADNVGESGLSIDTPYQIKNINTDENTFELYVNDEKAEINEGGFRLSVLLKDKPIKINELRFSLDVNVCDTCSFTYFNRDVIPIRYDNRALPVGLSAKVIKESPVIAEWKTVLTDLNLPTMLKNIHTVGLDMGENTSGTVRILVEGKNSVNKYNNSWDMLNLLYPNLVNFTFSCKGEKSLYADVRLRGINQIGISVISDSDKPFELKGLLIEYSLLKQKRGITY